MIAPAALQVADGLEQRHDVDVEPALARAQQPDLLEQHGHFQDVGDAVGLGDHVVRQRRRGRSADGHRPRPAAWRARRPSPRRRHGAATPAAAGCRARRPAAPHAPPRPAPHSRRPTPAASTSSAMTRSCTSEFCRRSSDARWKPKTSTARRSARRRPRARAPSRFRVSESRIVSRSALKSSAVFVGRRRPDRRMRRFELVERPRRGREPRIDADRWRADRVRPGARRADRASARPARAAHRRRARCGRRAAARRPAGAAPRDRSRSARWLCMAQRLARHLGGDEGIAVAVAADPASHAQEGRHVDALPRRVGGAERSSRSA